MRCSVVTGSPWNEGAGINGVHETAHAWQDKAGSVVLWNDEEVFQLSHIEETWHQDYRQSANSIFDDEMRCQRDMRVRGVRLRAYHAKLGDLHEILGLAA